MSDPRLAILRKTGDSDVQWLIARIDELEDEAQGWEASFDAEHLGRITSEARVAALEGALHSVQKVLDYDLAPDILDRHLDGVQSRIDGVARHHRSMIHGHVQAIRTALNTQNAQEGRQ